MSSARGDRRQGLAPRVRIAVVLIAAVLVVTAGRQVAAHPLDVGYLRIESSGETLSFVLDLDAGAGGLLLAVRPEAAGAEVIRARAGELAAGTYARAPITTTQGPCTFLPPMAEISGRTIRITGQARCPSAEGPRRWSFPFVRESALSSTFELLVKETIGGEQRLTVLDRYDHDLELAATTGHLGFAGFVWSGIEHIGVAPSEWQGDDGLQLPDGIDHILFLLALMLAGGTLLQLVGIASGFTVGHSITLALAALDIVRPPSEIIEPLIALSIALAAAEAFTGRFKQHRWKIATGFGLIHGFGFANALVELDLTTGAMAAALFGYNLGVELGQVVVVLVVAPLVMLAHRDQRTGALIVRALAAGIFIAGMYWFFERLAG